MRQNHELKSTDLLKKFSVKDVDPGALKGAGEVGKIVGQDRAIAALRFGLDTAHQGFNIYVAGMPRTGKMTAVRAFVEKLAASKPTPSDWCYVHNFDDAYQPKALEFPAGKAKEFQQDIGKLMEKVRLGIPKAFESEAFATKREAIVKALDDQRNERLDKLKHEVAEKGFALQLTQHGALLISHFEGETDHG